MFRSNGAERVKSWLIALFLTGAALGLSNCSQNGADQTQADKVYISPNHASRYDPDMANPGDNRPTVPPTEAVAPALENDSGNSGIIVPASRR